MTPEDVVRVEADGRAVKVTHLDKVLYPRTGTTKAEVLHHYASLAPVLLPLLAGRCVTRIRWPHGVGDQSFFEKNTPAGTPSWVRVVEVPGSGGNVRFPVVEDLATLIWLANLSALELHVHQWRVDAEGRPQPPDRLVVDLDPGEPAGLGECAQVALAARDWLEERGLRCVPVLSGSKGMHLYASLAEHPVGDSEEASSVARELATSLQATHPRLVTATMTKSRRVGKVFVDWSQNSASKTTVTPYSLRGREQPTVAAPLTWAEVEAEADDPLALEQVTLAEFPSRMERLGDLFTLD